MRRITLAALLVAALTACADHSSPVEPTGPQINPAVVVNERIPIFFGVVNPCNGEEVVSLEGDIHILISTTEDALGGTHVGVINQSHFSGIGAITGARYSGFFNSNGHFNVRPPFPQILTLASPGTMTISSGNVPNFIVVIVSHLTVNANGEVTVTKNEFRAECRG
jgi:hypothetical protein